MKDNSPENSLRKGSLPKAMPVEDAKEVPNAAKTARNPQLGIADGNDTARTPANTCDCSKKK